LGTGGGKRGGKGAAGETGGESKLSGVLIGASVGCYVVAWKDRPLCGAGRQDVTSGPLGCTLKTNS